MAFPFFNFPARSTALARIKANAAPTGNALVTTGDSSFGNSFFGIIRESFPGAWQRNIVVDAPQDILTFSAVYASISLIAGDISKLPPCLTEDAKDGSPTTVKIDRASPQWNVLIKPNSYQTRVQFYSYWLTQKLIYGNTYVFLQRDLRGIVTDMYIIDARKVQPRIAPDGSVWYYVNTDEINGVTSSITIPAENMMHDRMPCFWSPLIGVTPIIAAAASSTQGRRIQNNSAKFFENMSRPSGQITSPTTIDEVTADRIKKTFEQEYGGGNIGRLLVSGDGLKYEPMTIPFNDAQLIEQLAWTIEDVSRCFLVPLYKLSAANESRVANTAQLDQDYYKQCLQVHIEAIEALMIDGLRLKNMYVEFDLDPLLRMDPISRMEVDSKGVGAGILKINEARANQNRQKVDGGETPFLQQQNYPISQLATRPPPVNVAPSNGGKPKDSNAPPDANADDTGAEPASTGSGKQARRRRGTKAKKRDDDDVERMSDEELAEKNAEHVAAEMIDRFTRETADVR